jgi:hypothetical protein
MADIGKVSTSAKCFSAYAFEVKKLIIFFKKFKFSIKNAESFWRFQISDMGEKGSEEVSSKKKIRAKQERRKKLRNYMHTTFLSHFYTCSSKESEIGITFFVLFGSYLHFWSEHAQKADRFLTFCKKVIF